ncbi:unnamed protein product [Diatraea saccharalis]|uniref:Fatty acyl-CoA reductase n=1 Tax=Diatraea saccharalis TaxID=40085 RepID=A0A9N9WIQ6_9NEOP|nr:unnamed protein product [Diatraea saccharalis]
MENLNGNDPAMPNLNEPVISEVPSAENVEAISDYYNGAVILVTGGTGFVGKALLEKLLRSCPGIDTIYVLMRPKRGLTVEQRYKELLKNQVFDRIRTRWPERLSKLYPITGDVSQPKLGVSNEQAELLLKVTTLFHSAATVRFTEPLHVATTLNVQGTASLLKLAEDMPLLKALVHVSTAYSNAPRPDIEEMVYPPPYDPETIIRCTKMFPAETMEVISTTLQVKFKRAGHCPVYNVTSGSINPLTWGQFTRFCVQWARENPSKYVMWYPNFSFTESRFMNTFWEISCHFLPAFLYDILLKAQGRKAIMMKLAHRFKMAAATGEYFANHEWQFGVSELTTLHNEASATSDVKSFFHWPAEFNWETYIGAYILGIRRFILKDPQESLTHARTKLKRLYWVHRLFQVATGYYVFKFLAGRIR